MKLYEIADEYRDILSWLEDHEEEMGAEGGEHPELIDKLDQIESNFELKAESVALVIRELQVEAVARKAEADRLKRSAQASESRAAWLKDYLLHQLRRMGLKKVAGTRAKIARVKNGRPSVALIDPENIPDAYQKVVVTFNGQQAYEDLKAAGKLPADPGEIEVDGFRVARGEHVRIS